MSFWPLASSKGHSLTTLKSFWPFMTTYLPRSGFTFVKEFLYCDIRENMHTAEISSTTYLTRFVNIVCESPLTGKKEWQKINYCSTAVTLSSVPSIGNFFVFMRGWGLMVLLYWAWSIKVNSAQEPIAKKLKTNSRMFFVSFVSCDLQDSKF